MALKSNKIVNLTAESRLGEETVVRYSASVNSDTDVNSAYSEQILDTNLYNANKTEVRNDTREFRELIYQLEDELAAQDLETEE